MTGMCHEHMCLSLNMHYHRLTSLTRPTCHYGLPHIAANTAAVVLVHTVITSITLFAVHRIVQLHSRRAYMHSRQSFWE